MFGINRFQVFFERTLGKAELPEHESREPAMPPLQAKPAAGPVAAVPDHVNMNVDQARLLIRDWLHGCGSVAFPRR